MITPTDEQVEAAARVVAVNVAFAGGDAPGVQKSIADATWRAHADYVRPILTAAFSLAAQAGTVSFWVLEMIEEPRAPVPRYWAGNGVGWTYDISTAIHFERKEDVDAFQVGDWLRGKAVEHAMISRPPAFLPPQPSAALPGKESVVFGWDRTTAMVEQLRAGTADQEEAALALSSAMNAAQRLEKQVDTLVSQPHPEGEAVAWPSWATDEHISASILKDAEEVLDCCIGDRLADIPALIGAIKARAGTLQQRELHRPGYLHPASHKAGTEGVTAGARDVLAERERQVSIEGWTPKHDDAHGGGSLATAAACYAAGDALPTEQRSFGNRDSGTVPALWPRSWDYTWWKPTDRRRDLVKAGALILAEIDRLDRAALLAQQEGEER